MESMSLTITIDENELKKLDFNKQPTKEELAEAIHEAIYLAYARI